MNEQTASNLIRLTGLWKGKKAGTLAGSISPSTRLVIMPNNYKKSDAEPDYIAYIASQDRQDGQGKGQSARPTVQTSLEEDWL
jgi:hypothetical protein